MQVTRAPPPTSVACVARRLLRRRLCIFLLAERSINFNALLTRLLLTLKKPWPTHPPPSTTPPSRLERAADSSVAAVEL